MDRIISEADLIKVEVTATVVAEVATARSEEIIGAMVTELEAVDTVAAGEMAAVTADGITKITTITEIEANNQTITVNGRQIETQMCVWHSRETDKAPIKHPWGAT